jgi:Fe-S-cluster containining protein
MKLVSGTIELRVLGEAVKLDLTVPDAPVSTTTMLPVLQGMTNTLVAHAARQAERDGKAVTCREGCWACCRHLVPVSEEEARYLADIVAGLPEPRRSELQRRFEGALAVLSEAGLLEPLRDPGKRGERTLHDLGMAFFELNIACPFLDGARCSIHAQRPLACREHLVTSAPQNCDRPTAESVEKLPIPASIFGALIKLAATPESKAARFVPLVLALEWASQNPDRAKPVPGPTILKQIVENLSGKPFDL